MEGRTTFIIAQRLLTLKNADVILVLDHGRIVERGTHEDLLNKHGLYRQIYDALCSRDADVAEGTTAGLVHYDRAGSSSDQHKRSDAFCEVLLHSH